MLAVVPTTCVQMYYICLLNGGSRQSTAGAGSRATACARRPPRVAWLAGWGCLLAGWLGWRPTAASGGAPLRAAGGRGHGVDYGADPPGGRGYTATAGSSRGKLPGSDCSEASGGARRCSVAQNSWQQIRAPRLASFCLSWHSRQEGRKYTACCPTRWCAHCRWSPRLILSAAQASSCTQRCGSHRREERPQGPYR